MGGTYNCSARKIQMTHRHYIRASVFALLVGITLFCLYKAMLTPPDAGYGRVFNFLVYGLLTFLIWIPYNITCMFLDGNKKLGSIAIIIVALTLTDVALGAWMRNFCMQTMALVLCGMSLITLWILSVINFVSRKRMAEPCDAPRR